MEIGSVPSSVSGIVGSPLPPKLFRKDVLEQIEGGFVLEGGHFFGNGCEGLIVGEDDVEVFVVFADAGGEETEGFTGRGEGDGSALAVKEALASLLLQVSDTLTDGRLGESQFARSNGEAPFASHRLEYVQSLIFQHHRSQR